MVVDHSLRNAGVHEGSFPVLAHQENMATLVHSSQGKTILLLLEQNTLYECNLYPKVLQISQYERFIFVVLINVLK